MKTKITFRLTKAAARRAVERAGGDPADRAQVEQTVETSKLRFAIPAARLDGEIRRLSSEGYEVEDDPREEVFVVEDDGGEIWRGTDVELRGHWTPGSGVEEGVSALRSGESSAPFGFLRDLKIRREIWRRGGRFRVDLVSDCGEVEPRHRAKLVSEARRLAIALSKEVDLRVDVGFGRGARGFFERYRKGRLVERLRKGQIERFDPA